MWISRIFVVTILAPNTEHIVSYIPDILMEFWSLILMGFLGADIALTATALVGFAEIVSSAEDSFNEQMELVVRKVHRHALRRVSVFRLQGINKNRLDRIRNELSVRIQESDNFIVKRSVRKK